MISCRRLIAGPLLLQALLCLGPLAASVRSADSVPVEQWDIFELTLKGPTGGNPFTEVELSASFAQGDRTVQATGFYDGDGVYKIRFMPEAAGVWRYATKSNRRELNGKAGSFTVTAPTKNNHGPVRVRNSFHFAYADGTPT